MRSAIDFVSHLYAYLAVFPFIVFAGVWVITIMISSEKKTATKAASDVSTLFLVGANAALINQQFNTDYGLWMIGTILLIAFGLLGSMQMRKRGKSNPAKIFRNIWRMCFVLLSISYLIFMVVSISQIMSFEV